MKSKEQILTEIDNALYNSQTREDILKKRIADYITVEHSEIIRELNKDLPEYLAKIIADDSIKLIIGKNNIGATLSEMKEILGLLPLDKICRKYNIIIFLLIMIYNNILISYKDFFTNILRCNNITVEEKEKRIINYFNADNNSYFAVKYFIENGIIVVGDLKGFNTSFIRWILAISEAKADIFRYCYQYCIYKHIGADVTELEAINLPDNIKNDDRLLMLHFAEEQSKEFYNAYIEVKNNLEDIKVINNKNVIIQKSKQLTELLSKPIRVTDKQLAGNRPLAMCLKDILEENKITNLTEYNITKVINIISLLIARGQHKGETDTVSEYVTTINELGNISAGYSPNEEEKIDIYNALVVLDRIYLYQYKNKKETAVKVCTILKMENDTTNSNNEREHSRNIPNGKITLGIAKDILHQSIITTTEIEAKTIKFIKGEIKSRFINQIKLKEHKEEEALLNEVFGYSNRLEAAGKDQIKIQKAKDYKRKKQNEHKKKIGEFFTELKNKGIIESWERTENRQGKIIYSWKKKKIN